MAGPLEERYRTVRDLLPEYRVEMARGRIVVNESGTWQQNTIVFGLMRQLIGPAVERGWELWSDITVYLEQHADRYVPHLTVVPRCPRMRMDHAVYGDSTLLIVDVMSAGTAYEHYHVKPNGYASAGAPLYLVADPAQRTIRLYSGPGPHRYGGEVTAGAGQPLQLPAPWRLALTTRGLW